MSVKWDHIEAPRSLGGLAFGSIYLKNLGLLTQWWWKYAIDDGSLWKQVVQSTSDNMGRILSLDQN